MPFYITSYKDILLEENEDYTINPQMSNIGLVCCILSQSCSGKDAGDFRWGNNGLLIKEHKIHNIKDEWTDQDSGEVRTINTW